MSMAVDGGGGAAVSHAPHVLRCGELISVHAEQDHGSVCLGGGLGAFLIVIGGTHSTGVLACPGAGVALPAKAGAGAPSSKRTALRATRGRMPTPGMLMSTLPSARSAATEQPAKSPKCTFVPTARLGVGSGDGGGTPKLVPPPCKVDAEVDGEKAVEASQLSVGGAPVTAPSARGT